VKGYTFVDIASQVYGALVALLILSFHNETVPRWQWLVASHIVGLMVVHILIQLHASHQSLKTVDFLRHFYPVLLYVWFFSETGWINRMFFKEYMDPMAIRWEQSLFGCQPSVLFMQKLPYLVLSEVFYAAYFSYYLMIAGVGVALFLRNRKQFFHFISVMSFVFYICYAIFDILPIIGPRVFFSKVGDYSLPEQIRALSPVHDYPTRIQTGPFFKIMALVYRVFESPGSALPSSHVAVAVCTVVFSFRYLRPIRYLHVVAAVLLCLATVYCRYHYVIDVLAGLLTAAVLVPLGNWLHLSSAKRQEGG